MICVRNSGVELVGEMPSADTGLVQDGVGEHDVPGWKES